MGNYIPIALAWVTSENIPKWIPGRRNYLRLVKFVIA